ncbi:40S ribosomal protein S27-like [Antechinus flavipes]|uniref:40S ribosomal protein S27-like n=1 Tax=Antechinus flavipes TaxID=38775 RepID=UPI002235AB1E|nr:40S ribosomal protein S27-like [Antechinus flavipes]
MSESSAGLISKLMVKGSSHANLPLMKDFLHPSPGEEKQKHKKFLVQSPSSYHECKVPGYYKFFTVFSHTQTVVLCVGCSIILCQPPGGKLRLTDRYSFRQKQH